MLILVVGLEASGGEELFVALGLWTKPSVDLA